MHAKRPSRITTSEGDSFFSSNSNNVDPVVSPSRTVKPIDELSKDQNKGDDVKDTEASQQIDGKKIEKNDNSSDEMKAKQYNPPWTKPYIIGVAGTSGSGKTSVASKIVEELNTPWTVLLSLDNFYLPLSDDKSKLAFRNEYDFDSPNAVDLDLCYQCVKDLKEGHQTKIPIYSFAKHARTGKEITIYGANVIIIEGIYALYHQKLLDLMDLKIYVDTDLDICLARRLSRDILYRGRDLDGALKQWTSFVKPNAERFVKPTMQEADLVIPRGADNYIAIEMMIKHVSKQLFEKSEQHLKHLNELIETGKNLKLNQLDNLKILQSTNQIKSIHTILINKNTSRDDFIFFFNRIATILINKALECLTYLPPAHKVLTPLDYTVENSMELVETVIAVNIIRSGDCFMTSLKRTLPDIKIGKLLIQSDSKTGEPQLHSLSLPMGINNRNTKILLMDAQIISGSAVIMSIQVLIDHGIDMKDIIMVCYLASEKGVRRILSAFPDVKIVVGKFGSLNENGQDVDSDWWFRNRYIDSLYFGSG